MLKLEFGKWKEKIQKGISKGLSGTYCYQQKIKYREVKINNKLRIEEGSILEYLEKLRGAKEDFKPSQQHLVGYHYVCVIDNNGNDVFWIQGNVKSKDNRYCVFKGRGEKYFDVYYNWTDKEKAFKEFLDGLRKLFKVDLTIKEIG